MSEQQIAYENGRFWICRLGPGRYEVYENGITGARRCAQISYPRDPDRGWQRAVTECDRRADRS